MTRFDDIDLVDVPDQWDRIVQQAESAPVLAPAPESRRRWRAVWLGAAAAVLVAAGAVAVAVRGDDSTTQVATTEVVTTDPSVEGPVGEEGAAPVLACTGGELLAGSIPDEAALGGDPIFDIEPFQDVGPSRTWSWRVGDLDVQLVVPGIPWVDFVGERTEALVDPPGTLAYMRDPSGERETVHAIVQTGLPEPCARAEVIVAGGTEAERVAAATGTARALSWQATDQVAASDLRDLDGVRRWALRDAAGRVTAAGVANVYVYEWRVGDDVPLEWTDPERAEHGSRRWTVVIVGGSGVEFQSLRGPAGSPPSVGSAATYVFAGGNIEMFSLSRDRSLPTGLEPVQGPIPFLAMPSPILGAVEPDEQHERMQEMEEQARRAQEEREQAEQRQALEESSPD